MSSLTSKLKSIPEGAGVLFFIQMVSTLGFAVLYSTLVLYTTRHLHFPASKAAVIMGVFGAFNYGLHLFGGYLGGRFLSNRNLFVGGMVLQVFGSALIAGGAVELDGCQFGGWNVNRPVNGEPATVAGLWRVVLLDPVVTSWSWVSS